MEELNAKEIESLLHEEIFARIGYVDRRSKVWVVPFTYAYDGKSVYGYSLLGAKIEGMNVNPDVCVEVDRIRDNADWWSVVARGKFEQLTGDAAVEAVERISARLRTVARAEDAVEPAEHTYVAREGGPGIAFRIRLNEKHGRCAIARSVRDQPPI
jgi:nitroimidazol reductase NimA-like FMN-containing flavoprotein (pyridoxamine 5'-phosphate oxidase superfamily)